MKILVHGNLQQGQHSRQRADALEALDGIKVIRSRVLPGSSGAAWRGTSRLLNRMRRPLDLSGENQQLLAIAKAERPDIILVENSRVIRASTLRDIRDEVGSVLAYLTPDDIIAPHNQTLWLRETFPVWDLFFTTKTFNVEELRLGGVRRPLLIGNIFTPTLHRPLPAAEVGPDYEAFDIVFVGQYERERARALDRLAAAGMSIVIYGLDAGLLAGRWSNSGNGGIVLREAVWDRNYVRAMHHGRIALGFLRKINRDRITQRSVEVPAMARPLLAEKTEEHDMHFVDGVEYVGFSNDDDMIEEARRLLADAPLRRSIGEAGRRRCIASEYDVNTLARRLVHVFSESLSDRADLARGAVAD